MEIKRKIGESRWFCDLCGCEEKPYGYVGTPEAQLNNEVIEEECHLCITCYNALRAELVGRGGRFNEIVK